MSKTAWVTSAISQADTLWQNSRKSIEGKSFSDVQDADGLQYVDLVMEGGGMLGIALVGYTYILEKAGIRFRKVAGTSAGAINALFLAAAGTPGSCKSAKLLDIMTKADFASFEDGERFARKTVQRLLKGKGLFSSLALHPFDSLRTCKQLLREKGLNPGDAFTQWLQEELRQLGITNTAQLNQRINQFPTLHYRGEPDPIVGNAEVALVAADITTETRAVFPAKAPLYFSNPDAVNPAEFVRASMSVPGFFKPYTVKDIPQLDECSSVAENWRSIKGIGDPRLFFKNGFPKEIQFVDGGLVSNFPFDIFHKPVGTPKLPTFGIKLEVDHYQPKSDKVGRFAMGLINTCRNMLDNHVRASLNAEYHTLVKEIAIEPMTSGEHPHWLDFAMPGKHCEHLFLSGVRAAIEFLSSGFQWEDYLVLRQPEVFFSGEQLA
ncbi:patatin-like phospholipase family protein [Microbulbifer variabilis]|uniref:patatin-like phospholipase family protein n=1 Tax=Microbulbifer variabilis TaxID=266805 RepID=UPI000370D70D|nr:patatin-like phospholipase family protein [Microbulbifer variabilis]